MSPSTQTLRQIWVSLRSSAQGLEFALSDDGKGFDLNVPGTGLGLLGNEGADRYAGGTIQYRFRPGKRNLSHRGDPPPYDIRLPHHPG